MSARNREKGTHVHCWWECKLVQLLQSMETEMVGQTHQLNGHEFEQTLGDSEGQEIMVLQSMESQRVGHDLAAEQQWKFLKN